MEVLIMKKLLAFAVLPLLIATGCTTQYQARAPYDDVYYSSRDVSGASNAKVVVKQSQEPAAAVYSNTSPQETAIQDNQSAATEQYAAPGGDTYSNNNYYDDYYDYAYASRLRRFHSNYYFPSYYNDFYTNMYWYDYNPWNWGTSIYYNSGWFGPSFGMSFGWGWPSYRYGWGGYPSYGGYWNGYNDGYYNGYYNNYYSGINNIGWYANEGQWFNNDKNYYYGHRGQSGFAGGSSNGRNTSGVNGNAAVRTLKGSADLNSNNVGRDARNMNASPAGVNARAGNTNVSRDASSVSSRTQQNPDLKQSTQTGRGRYIAPSQNSNRVSSPGNNGQGRQVAPQQTRYTNPQQQINSRENTNAQPRGNVYRDNAPRPASQPARTYSQPATRIQSYSSPSYSKPRSSQEYTTPKYRDMRNNNNQNNSQPQQRSGSNSERNGGGTIRENTPRRSSSNESQPSRSTYSAPSRSSENSYSAPARSSSNSSSGSSERSSSSGSSNSSGSRSGRR